MQLQTKARLENSTKESLQQLAPSTTSLTEKQQSNPSDRQTDRQTEAIRDWLVTYIADLLEVSTDDIDTDVPFDAYGLDSSAAIGLTGDLEDWLGKEVDPILLYDYPTVESLVSYLS